ncbi:hypothetical protein OPV22_004266 [Ensete ventricosum]|uniref:DUF4005 domain-containing protein n=1 Tax=Ensete ventricosum TaxID=4639 RepID=A0AAV8S3B3_ENSVE|nr:hypothetical protein OPV22_004266 [Ensete ventricosum]
MYSNGVFLYREHHLLSCSLLWLLVLFRTSIARSLALSLTNPSPLAFSATQSRGCSSAHRSTKRAFDLELISSLGIRSLSHFLRGLRYFSLVIIGFASLGVQHLKISVMGKSPAKWIKAVIFGKRSSRSHTSKGKDGLKPGVDKEHFAGGESSNVTVKSLVITQPVLVSNNSSVTSSENRTDSTLVTGAVRVENQEIVGHQASSDAAKTLEERAATKVQAAFRGYQSRRVFCALKGIIRLQALIRGHLVRRQAVTTLHCMWGIVKFQALVRGQRVRLSGIGLEVRTKYPKMKSVDDKKLDFSKMQLSANRFVCKLLSALPVTKPVQIHYDPVEPNSVFSWLDRWTSSHFWSPLPRSKKSVNVKSRVRCSSAVESESVRLKSNVHKNVAAKVDVMTESERHKRITRKMPSPPADFVVENPQSEIEKVKRSLRKVPNSTKEPSENQKPTCTPRKVTNSLSDSPQVANEHSSMKIKKDSVVSIDSKLEIVAAVKSVASGGPENAVIDDSTAIKPHRPEEISKEESISNCDGELSLKDEPISNEIQKSSKRRASFPPKPEPFADNASQNAPRLPSYMATTESAKAKLRGQVSPRVGSDSAERYNMTRRHSLPTSTNGKLNSQSSRAHKLIQASYKDGIRNDRSFTSSRDGSEKSIQVGWRSLFLFVLLVSLVVAAAPALAARILAHNVAPMNQTSYNPNAYRYPPECGGSYGNPGGGCP